MEWLPLTALCLVGPWATAAPMASSLPADQGRPTKVAIIQYQVQEPDRVGADAARLEAFIRQAAKSGADLVVAPETCFYRYEPWEQNGVTAADLAGQYEALKGRFSALAGELRVGLVIGLREPLSDTQVYNTALLFGPDGRVLGKHRKCVPSSAEKGWTVAGTAATAFQTPFGRVGMLICKDAKSRWASAFDKAGIDLYILIAGDKDGRSFRSFTQTCRGARCHGVLANQQREKGNSAFGYPDGRVEFLGGGETAFYAELPLVRPAGAGAAGTTTRPKDMPGAKGPAPGQIVVDPDNPAWLARRGPDGGHKPFFLCGPGDPEGFLYRGRRRPDGTRDGDQLQLIRKLAASGSNCIYLMAVRSHGGDGDRTHNPFVDNDPDKGLDADVLAQWQEWFAAMDRAGIVIFLFLYDDSARIWDTGDAVGPPEREFIRGLVGRFADHKNLIWCIAEEYQERLSAKRVSAIAAEIRAADARRHPIAVHKLTGVRFEEFAEDANIDQFAMQLKASGPQDLHRQVLAARRLAGGRYNLNAAEVHPAARGAELRRQMWAAAMGGAYFMALGMDIVSTDAADLADCGRLVRFFETADVRRMSPRDDLAAGDTEYVLAEPGGTCVAYCSERKAALGLKGRFAGRWDVTWLDCASGAIICSKAVAVAGRDPSFQPPAGFGREVALHLRPAEAARRE